MELKNERRLSILLVEQNMRMALKFSDYGYVIQLGQVMVSGKSQELQNDRKVFESYLGTS